LNLGDICVQNYGHRWRTSHEISECSRFTRQVSTSLVKASRET
jgi:hypothetical protein